jgi:hypothetical protein
MFGAGAGGTHAMSPAALAQRIRDHGYDGGPVRLISCSAGACVRNGKNAAQQVADSLGMPVVAPSRTLWHGWSQGKLVIGDRAGRRRPRGSSEGDIVPDGEWRVHFPSWP